MCAVLIYVASVYTVYACHTKKILLSRATQPNKLPIPDYASMYYLYSNICKKNVKDDKRVAGNRFYHYTDTIPRYYHNFWKDNQTHP